MKSLTSIALLGFSSVVNAFYPYHFPTREPIPASSRIKIRNTAATKQSLSFPLRKVAVKRANTHTIVKADTPSNSNSVGVNQDGFDYAYMIEVAFGPGKKVINLLLDTAAINTWVMSGDCKSNSCTTHNTYSIADSNSLTFASKSFSIAYGSGKVAGTVAIDNVTVLGKSFPLTFGLASNVSDEFSSFSMDGIMGFGRVNKVTNNPTGVGAPTMMDVLVSQGLIKNNLFGLRLSRAADGQKNGKLDFGEPDTSAYTGDLNYIQVTENNRGFWEIPLDKVTVDGKDAAIQSNIDVILDSGSTFMLLPPADAQAIHKMITGSAVDGDAFTIPCNTAKPIALVFGGKAYNISPKDYVGEVTSGTTCSSNIIGRTTFGSTQWLVGDVFLKNVYSVYDADGGRVGLASIAGVGSDTTSAPKPSSTNSRSPLIPGSTMAVNGTGQNSSSSSSSSTTRTGQGNTLSSPSASISALAIGLLVLAICF